MSFTSWLSKQLVPAHRSVCPEISVREDGSHSGPRSKHWKTAGPSTLTVQNNYDSGTDSEAT